MIALPIHGFFAFLPIAMPPTSVKMTATTEAMPTTEASTMSTTEASTASTVAPASSTMCERGGGRERQNPGQNQTDQ
jgi:tRNA/tmRNA/rRNA uracil-C5-methylase (TrmA/RlmC/RlmD family)